MNRAGGEPDLAVANFGANTVSVLLNAGNGTFAAKVDYPVDSDPSSITAVDVNGAGTLDLAVTNFQSDTVSVLVDTCAP